MDTARTPRADSSWSRLATRLRTPAFCTPSEAAAGSGESAAALPVTVIRARAEKNRSVDWTAVSRAPTPRATSSASSVGVQLQGRARSVGAGVEVQQVDVAEGLRQPRDRATRRVVVGDVGHGGQGRRGPG